MLDLHREKIRIELERLGWSEAELAKRMGVRRQYLNRIMVGKIGISLKGIDRIANALGLSGKDLIK